MSVHMATPATLLRASYAGSDEAVAVLKTSFKQAASKQRREADMHRPLHSKLRKAYTFH